MNYIMNYITDYITNYKIEEFPIEILVQILKYIDLRALSKLTCCNKLMYKTISNNKWVFVDNLIDSSDLLIPLTKETYFNYKYYVDWSHIILQNEKTGYKIPESVIEWISDTQDLLIISSYQEFSHDLIYKLIDKISCKNLLNNQNLPIDILYSFIDSDTYILTSADWYTIWTKQTVNYEFIIKYEEYIQWHPLCGNKSCVSFEFINRYHSKIIWPEFTKHSINEKILELFVDRLDFISWNNISRNTQLSDEFIKKYLLYLDLGCIFRYQTLSLELLNTLTESFTNDEFVFYFQSICLYQKLTSEFIIKYKDKITIKHLIRNKNIPKAILHSIYGN